MSRGIDVVVIGEEKEAISVWSCDLSTLHACCMLYVVQKTINYFNKSRRYKSSVCRRDRARDIEIESSMYECM